MQRIWDQIKTDGVDQSRLMIKQFHAKSERPVNCVIMSHLELDPPDQSDIEEEKRHLQAGAEVLGCELNIDVDPWMETVFLTRRPLLPDTLYTCSCPAYGKSILRMPETTENREQRKTNRQMNYPLPTVLGKERFDGLGVNNAAGIIESWESKSESQGATRCASTRWHAMFIDHLKVKEPSHSYPSIETSKGLRGDKLKADIAEVQDRFYLSLERGEITTTGNYLCSGTRIEFR